MNKDLSSKGFTIIELLVVISIISLLASIVLVNVNIYMAKARDARKMSDVQQISKALYMFYAQKGYMPTNYNPCCGACTGSTAYNQSMQELVDAGFLPSIPNNGYCYYNYGSGNSVGAIVMTYLETLMSTTGIGTSCRPWAPGQNWCDQNNNGYYCMCNIH